MNGFESDSGQRSTPLSSGPNLIRRLPADSRPLSPLQPPHTAGKKRLVLDDIIGLTNPKHMSPDHSSAADSDASSVYSDDVKSLSSDGSIRPSRSAAQAESSRRPTNIPRTMGFDEPMSDIGSVKSESTYVSSGESGSDAGGSELSGFDDKDDLSEYSQASDATIQLSYEEKQRLKRQYLDKIAGLAAKGFIAAREYNMASSYEDVKAEYDTLHRRRDMTLWTKNMREYMVTGATFAEYVNRTYVPLDIHLDGWSEQVYNRIDECDEIFEQLYDKYGSSIEMNPELQLATWVVKSAVMHHLTAKYFKSSAAPGLDDILRQNPDIMRNISRAATGQHAASAGATYPSGPGTGPGTGPGQSDIDRVLGDLRAGQVPGPGPNIRGQGPMPGGGGIRPLR